MQPTCDSPRHAALTVIRTLRSAGYTAYLAGGCVRDTLLGLAPKDYDVATDATPDTVQQLFPNTAAVGAAFGVVLVYLRKPSQGRHTIEVATFRADGHYADGRRPDGVRFTTAQEDAQRRDFTINGLFADPPPTDGVGEDTIIDFVGGQDDLKAGILRAIGEPSARFGEDYLRMLRAVRFASRYRFTIEPRTAEAITQHAPKLDRIARERIGDEVRRMLMGNHPAQAVNQLHELGLDQAIFASPAQCLDAQPLERLADQADYATRLSVWMKGRIPLQSADAIRDALMLSNEEHKGYNDLMGLTAALSSWEVASVAAKKRLANHPRWSQAMMKWQAEHAYPTMLETILAEVDRFAHDGIGLAPTPFVTGDDLIAAGLTPGPNFKTILDLTYDAQLDGRVTNQDQALAFAQDQA
ncbi:MAG: CCA tRNA nucleotidyltransferase [Phycisphaerales bacterium JB063]